jgi:hypothetical protein
MFNKFMDSAFCTAKEFKGKKKSLATFTLYSSYAVQGNHRAGKGEATANENGGQRPGSACHDAYRSAGYG